MFDLPEKITIWHPFANDGFGVTTWSGPFVVDSRNALKQEKFTDSNGDQQISKAVIYAADDNIIATGARLVFGESAAIEPPAEADDVRAYASTPSGTNLKKAWL